MFITYKCTYWQYFMLTSSKLPRDNDPDWLEPLESLLAIMKQDILIYHSCITKNDIDRSQFKSQSDNGNV